MTARNRRTVLVIAISVVIVSSIAAGAILLLLRPSVEIVVTNVSMVPDASQNGVTEVRVHLILRNAGSSPSNFALLTLVANDPTKGGLFDTFAHTNVRLEPGETRTFYESTNVTGHWSKVAFTVKVFPSGAPHWERTLVPDQPVTWTVW
jgi:hypothetical protein